MVLCFEIAKHPVVTVILFPRIVGEKGLFSSPLRNVPSEKGVSILFIKRIVLLTQQRYSTGGGTFFPTPFILTYS